MTVMLVLGGARSGKSKRAEWWAKQWEREGCWVRYLATSPNMAGDDAWSKRVAEHRNSRPAHWQTIEETLQLCAMLERCDAGDVLLVDCLTLWLSNVMWKKKDVVNETAALCATLKQSKGHVVLVSNELGMGLVPDTALGRDFRDAQGRLNQAVAEVADGVELVVAGLPMRLKGVMK